MLQDKKRTETIIIKTFCSEIDATVFWPESRSDECHFLSLELCSDELYCPLHQSGVAVAGTTNAVNTRQSEAVTVSLFFPPLTPRF